MFWCHMRVKGNYVVCLFTFKQSRFITYNEKNGCSKIEKKVFLNSLLGKKGNVVKTISNPLMCLTTNVRIINACKH